VVGERFAFDMFVALYTCCGCNVVAGRPMLSLDDLACGTNLGMFRRVRGRVTVPRPATIELSNVYLSNLACLGYGITARSGLERP
jgi:hypothetical protein